MLGFFRRILEDIEAQPFSLSLFSGAFLALIVFRIGIESLLGGFASQSLTFFVFEFTHTFLFFLTAFLLLLPVISLAGARSLKGAAHLLLLGFLIILTPPIIDAWLTEGRGLWSFYQFDSLAGLLLRFLTFFGDHPDIGITYGVRVEVALVTLGVGFLAFLRGKSWRHLCGVAFLTYSILFFLGTLPSYLTMLLQGFSAGFFAINAADIAGLFLSPSEIFSRDAPDLRTALNVKMSLWYAAFLCVFIPWFLWYHFRSLFWALFRNVRWPQIFYHGGLLALGGLLAWHFTTPVLLWDHLHVLALGVLLTAVGCAWLASVVTNDCFDIAIDRCTNVQRPLPTASIPKETYVAIGWLFFAASLLLASLVHFSAALILGLYQAIAWIYSAPPLRLKRIPGVATALASAAGILILLIGFLVVAPQENFSALPPALLFFLFTAYAVALPLKDFKDIAGDRSDHVLTFPILLGEERARLIFGGLFFLLFVMSSFILHLPGAFFPALIAGSASFFLLQTARDRHKWCSYRRLPLLMLGIIFVYGLFLAGLIATSLA